MGYLTGFDYLYLGIQYQAGSVNGVSGYTRHFFV